MNIFVPVTIMVRTAAEANSAKTSALSGFNLFSKTTRPVPMSDS